MICSFTGEYRFLSNFWMCDVTVGGITYPSTEHAYQALKAVRKEDHMLVVMQTTPHAAKRIGATIELRPDWEVVKIPIMRRLVNAKFEQHPDLMQKLLDTKPYELVEGNTWKDTFWGQCPLGKGRNELGKILMGIRDDISRSWDEIQIIP